MGYGIFRIEKLKQMSNLKESLKHALRKHSKTPNADPNKLSENIKLTGSKSVEEIMSSYEERLKARTKSKPIRPDQVRAIEVLVTASPESMHAMTKEQQIQYLKDSLEFANKEFGGAENLLHAEIHMDETTPHLTAFYIPLATKTYRGGVIHTDLNAKQLMGGRAEYTKRQTKFHDEVSSKYGLERGEINSKAEHVAIKDFYRQLNKSVSFMMPDFEKGLKDNEKTSVEVPLIPFVPPKIHEMKPFLYVEDLNNVLNPFRENLKRLPFYGFEEINKAIDRQTKRKVEEERKQLQLEFDEKFKELQEKKANFEIMRENEIKSIQREKTTFLRQLGNTVRAGWTFNDSDKATENKVINAILDVMERFSVLDNENRRLKLKIAENSDLGAENERLKRDLNTIQEKLDNLSDFEKLKQAYYSVVEEKLEYVLDQIPKSLNKIGNNNRFTMRDQVQEFNNALNMIHFAKTIDENYGLSLEVEYSSQINQAHKHIEAHKHLLNLRGMGMGR